MKLHNLLINIQFNLIDIINYIGDSKRPLIEGTEILKCNHIFEFGIKEQSENKVVFMALCLQTSNLNGYQICKQKFFNILNQNMQ
ncbi:SWIM-type domain-containing protein [Aphis craccivora]|uniref:SWIM-type domain-containing protein n=1 Tax=Aphis craccivora TaxID=307492 RepID=A0A6G0VTK3_APHCR|nr:SWIM-type domain-containing protein [Aphis craccivora]